MLSAWIVIVVSIAVQSASVISRSAIVERKSVKQHNRNEIRRYKRRTITYSASWNQKPPVCHWQSIAKHQFNTSLLHIWQLTQSPLLLPLLCKAKPFPWCSSLFWNLFLTASSKHYEIWSKTYQQVFQKHQKLIGQQLKHKRALCRVEDALNGCLCGVIVDMLIVHPTGYSSANKLAVRLSG